MLGKGSETLWCEVCEDERPAEATFCHKCGSKVTRRMPDRELESQEAEPELVGIISTAVPKRQRKKQRVIVASFVFALLAAAGTYGLVTTIHQQREEQQAAEEAAAAAEAAAEKQRAEAETLLDAFGEQNVLSYLPSCEQIEGLASSDSEKWEEATSELGSVREAREAERLLASVRSAYGVLDGADVEAYANGFEQGLLEGLDSLFDSSTRDEEAPAAQLIRWESEWLTLARDSCPIEFMAFDRAFSSLTKSAAKFERVGTLASQVPWYPEEYSELVPGIAFKWVDARADCYNCYQWDADFISQTTCNSVYAEVDILDSSGRVIGWTNDTLRSVRAGEVGRLTFQTYRGSGILSARFSEFNCR